MTELTVGIDIGGTNTKYGIVDRSGHVHFHGNIPTTQFEEFQEYFDAMANALREGIKQLPPNSEIVVV